MILRSEITCLAREQGVPPSTIDKDWVLGHIIAGIFRQKWARETLLFKGGTCLKKCYIPGYRFSEDIDFTLLRDDFVLTYEKLEFIINEIVKTTGIRFAPFSIQPIHSRNRHFGFSTIVKFWGGDHRRDQEPPMDFERWHSSVKIEMTWHEMICFPKEQRLIHHDYSDSQQVSSTEVPCYRLFEIVAEKLRATIQRSYPAPRDYYDLWSLLKTIDQEYMPEIIDAFLKKAAYKNIPDVHFNDLFQPERLNRSAKAWDQSLGAHLPAGSLPSFSIVIEELKGIIKPYFK